MNSVRCLLETRVSNKGNKYEVLVIKLTPNYEKLVFLDKAEIELLKSVNDVPRREKFDDIKFPDLDI